MSTFIIRNKLTHEQWIADSGKSSWSKPQHAKSAWKRSVRSVPIELQYRKYVMAPTHVPLPFHDQDVYEVVEVYSEKEVDIQKKLHLVAAKLSELKQTLNDFNTGLSLEEYDTLHGDIEALQILVHEIIEN